MMELEKLVHFDCISLSLSVIKPIQHLVLSQSLLGSLSFFPPLIRCDFVKGSQLFTSSKYGQTYFFWLSLCAPIIHHPPYTLQQHTHIHTHTHFLPIALRSPPPRTTLSSPTPSHPPSQPYPAFQHSICPRFQCSVVPIRVFKYRSLVSHRGPLTLESARAFPVYSVVVVFWSPLSFLPRAYSNVCCVVFFPSGFVRFFFWRFAVFSTLCRS